MAIYLLAIVFLLSVLLFANNIYFRYFGSIINFGALTLIGQASDVSMSIVDLLRWRDLIYFVDLLVLGIFFKRYNFTLGRGTVPASKRNLKSFWGAMLLSFLMISLVFAVDFRELKKLFFSSYDYNLVERRYGLVAAHMIDFSRFFYFSQKDLSPDEEKKIVDWVSRNKVKNLDHNSFTGLASGKRVFLIQIESLESFVIGKKIAGKEITPNLNRLASESYYFPNGESLIGGGLTSDSDFMSNTSFYPLPNLSVFVTYGNRNFTSISKALGENGYKTFAYHAYKRNFWNRGVAFESLGYDHFYAADEYEPGENVILGLNDKSFYEQTLEKIDSNQERAFHYLISLSSHHPFDMSQEFQFLDVPYKEDYDYRSYHYLQAIHYADYALGLFIEGLKKKGIYDDSLLIVYGDHPANIGDRSEPKVINTIGEDTTKNIPFFYKIPGEIKSERFEKKTSQLDLMPTILNLLNINTSFPMFGEDVFGDEEQERSNEDSFYSEAIIKYNLFDYFY